MTFKSETIEPVNRGAEVIRGHAKRLPETPGVYRMIDANADVLYVGKARALRRRVLSYTQPNRLSNRIKRMVALTRTMEFIHTATEAEALLLESNLIKKYRPPYNIVFRDDKSYPYILVDIEHDFPKAVKYRGTQKGSGKYFGPFANAGAVNKTITALQKGFLLRNCSEHVFNNRSRPCLQYHIKRCTAPCVGYVSKETYAQQVRDALDFLSGKSHDIQKRFALLMEEASNALDFETAARYRDRLRGMAAVQAHQEISAAYIDNADVVGVVELSGVVGFQVFFFRGGQNYGNRSYFQPVAENDSLPEMLAAFLVQFYEDKPIPPLILLPEKPEEMALMKEAFCVRAGRKIDMRVPQRGERLRLIDFVLKNTRAALERHLAETAAAGKNLKQVAELFGLDSPPQRIEVYDNSHISGTNMVGAMIVAGPEGFRKNAYRKFNIKQADASDDYGMMREVMTRRFSRALKEDKGPGSEDWPDLVLIDGGQGQLTAVTEIFEELGIAEDVTYVAIAKGPDRNAGREKFFMPGRDMFQLPINDPALHYLQRLRDEAHRFAIGAHRARRAKTVGTNPIDEVPGIGPGRKKALMQRFGSGREITRASIEDLASVEGISAALAEKIYGYFHN